jgi:hypothetical protein
MLITKKSAFSGKDNTMDLPVTEDQIARFKRGEGYVQDIFPRLNPDQREFLISGVTPEEWDECMGPDPDE